MLKGSHKLGRIEHKQVGEQVGADMERVEQVMKVREHDHLAGKASTPLSGAGLLGYACTCLVHVDLRKFVLGASSGGGGDGTRRCSVLSLQCTASK